ncbi:hypothetical protein FDP41_009758 [Naegleria fowleri]|uniref:Uncharacterized protein n=1 Tax=Naegleria fowleri TaxID=5763 RepID=A0A6A5BAE0_NAEFO|nr:uncharacterized protein FDP41_009758 [Naegleria fowleri]KAF0972062.1 hypothetical protein FDP41_009758 [Naegleria fowleri]CAG4709945.1 unnamed protein product [Naegleria fowleri]
MNRSLALASKLLKSTTSSRSSSLMMKALSTPSRVRAFHQTAMRRDEEETQKAPEVKVRPAWKGWVDDVLNFFHYPIKWILAFAVIIFLWTASQRAAEKKGKSQQ